MTQTVPGFALSFVVLLGLCVFLLGVGIALFWLGRRGRRVDDHPVCRGCGFDLFGTKADGEQSPRCPECGVTRSPRVGNRQRRPGWMSGGLLLFCLGLVGGGAVVWSHADAAKLAPHKPLWLLRWEMRSGTGSNAEAAIDEVIARLSAGALTSAESETLFDDAVTHGPAGNAAVAQIAFGSRWDLLAYELMRLGHGSPAERIAVARSWVVTELELRPRVRRGAPVPMRVHSRELGPPSLGTGNNPFLERQPATLRFGEFTKALYSSGGGTLNTQRPGSGSGWSGKILQPGRGLPEDLAEGAYELTVEQPLAVFERHNGPLLVQWSETLTATFEVVASDGDPVTLRRDPAMAAAIEQHTSVEDDRVTVRRGHASLSIDIDNVSGPVAYQMYLQRGDQRWPCGTISSNLNGSHGFHTGDDLPDELGIGDVVDLVFEPDPDVARKTTDLTEILDHGFTIPGVTIVANPTNP